MSLPLFDHDDLKRICALVLRTARDVEPRRCSFRALAQVADVTEHQVERWARGEQLPGADSLMRVLCYLGEDSRDKCFSLLEDRERAPSASRHFLRALQELDLGEADLARTAASERVPLVAIMNRVVTRAGEIQAQCIEKPREVA